MVSNIQNGASVEVANNTGESIALYISDCFSSWDDLRRPWKDDLIELRDYLFQVSTKSTTNAKLPWKNSTSTPKLCQLRDNLHANYMAALFPNDSWFEWQASDKDAATEAKADYITAYMKKQLSMMNFTKFCNQAILDFIDYGNTFATVCYIKDIVNDSATNSSTISYKGPMPVRISPYDVVINPTAASFEMTPKIVRKLMTIPDLMKEVAENPDAGYMRDLIIGALNNRKDKIQQYKKPRGRLSTSSTMDKVRGYIVDGFGSYEDYIKSDYVELLEYYGDYYDRDTDTLYRNRVITCIDRDTCIRNIENPSWLGTDSMLHCGWRLRPDNLYAMGPLDNLVGMQYRIDHLENLKADALDVTVYPVFKIKGDIANPDFVYEPNARIPIGDEGDIIPLTHATSALQVNMEIQNYMDMMEELAGAPKQAMGVRTAGEKTAYEVQTLENAAGRIFQNKIKYFEENFLEPILNMMFEIAVRNFDASEQIPVYNKKLDIVEYVTISKSDIEAKGKLRAIGSRHFVEQARIVQSLTSLLNSAVGQDPDVKVHISGYETAKLMEKALGLKEFSLVSQNKRLYEQGEAQIDLESIKEEVDMTLSQEADVEGIKEVVGQQSQQQKVNQPLQMPPMGVGQQVNE